MSDFQSDIFLKLAKTADDFGLIKEKSQFGDDFGKEDLDRIEKFKNAIFALLMLRARRFMQREVTNKKGEIVVNDNVEKQLDRFCYAEFSITMMSGHVHPEEREQYRDHFDGELANGPIGRMVGLSRFDEALELEFVKLFKDYNVTLACS